MADVKISALPPATTPLTGSEVLPIVQGGTTDKVSVADLTAGRTVSAAAVSVAAGTVSAPGLTFSGDTNTGIYSPAADTIAFTEGGTESMRIDASGNVGIGGLPFDRLDVHGGTTVRGALNLLSNTALLSWGTNTYGAFNLQNGTVSSALALNTNQAELRAVSNHPYVFYTNNLERMRIDASGNVGIGTSSPTSRLTVQGSGSSVEIYQNSASVRFSSSPNRTNNYYLGANISDSVDAGFIIGQGTDIGTGTPRIIINSSGNIGVGGSPGTDSRLRIEGTESRLRSVNTSSGAIAYFGAMSPNEARAWSVTGTDLTLGTSNTERMRITASGLVGINTSNPGANLDVANSGTSAATNVVRVLNATDGASAGLLGFVKFGSTAPTYGPYTANNVGVNCAFTNLLFGTETFHDAIFYTHNNERMRITAAGNVVAGGSVALATTATNGFLYVPTCAGIPTGTPTAITGMAPIVVNTTNNKLYFYSGGAWRDAGP